MNETGGAGHQGTYEAGGAGHQGVYEDGGMGRHDKGQDSDDTNSEGEGTGRQGENEAKGAGRQGTHKVEGGRRRAASDTSSSRSFGPTNSYGTFHHEVTKVFTGLKGSNTIHDNRLVYGGDEGEHNRKTEMVELKYKGSSRGKHPGTQCQTTTR